MRRFAAMTAGAVLLGGIAAAGAAAAQDDPMGPRGGPMMMVMGAGRGGIDFAAIDSDGNGSLSRSELLARATAEIAKADTNGDGVLDRDEIIAALPGPHGGLVAIFSADPAGAFADRILALMGATEAGKVEVAALAAQRVNLLLAVADTDHDAAISKAEADAMQARRDGWMARHHDMRHHGIGDRGPDGKGPGGPGGPGAEPPRG